MRDVLALPVTLLALMPAPSTLVLSAAGRPVLWTAARWRAQEAVSSGVPTMTPLEYEAASWAAQEGRAGRSEMAAWVSRKVADPLWRLTVDVAVGDAPGLMAERVVLRRRYGRTERVIERDVPKGRLVWPLGRALEALGAELVDVVFEEVRR